MENQNQSQPIPQVPFQQSDLPNATAALVLGIISIPTCCCFGVVGLVCGIIAIVFGNKAIKLYESNPSHYTFVSLNNAKSGKICGIIGVVLSSLCLFYWLLMIIYSIMFGTFFSGTTIDF